MHAEKVYRFFHRLIRHALPDGTLSRFFHQKLRQTLFPEVIPDTPISKDVAVGLGKATKACLAPEVRLPDSSVIAANGAPPAALFMPGTTLPPLHVYTLENGYCLKNTVLDKDRLPLSDIFPEIHTKSIAKKYSEVRASKPVGIDGEGIALNVSYADNYYHWFIDLLAPLLLLPQRSTAYIHADVRFSYQRETLALLGIPPERILPASEFSLYRFNRLHVVPVNAQREYLYGVIRDFARSLEDAHKLPVPADGCERLYISRGDVKRRRGVVNEEDLLPILSEFGFKRVLLSGQPVLNQIAQFRQARYVIFPQGAACTNMLFCRPDTAFLELYSPLFLNRTSVRISRSLELNHHILLGERPTGSHKQADYFIEPQKFHRALRLLCRT